MKKMVYIVLSTLWLSLTFTGVSNAGESAPYGKASVENIDYAPQKVLYDVAAPDMATFEHVLDRVSYLNTVYNANPFEASIVMVLHGDEIPFFAIANADKYHDLMQRAKSLTQSGPIEFRMCRIAAQGHGFEPEQINGFVRVVPMADAEIIRLQQEEGYAYMQ